MLKQNKLEYVSFVTAERGSSVVKDLVDGGGRGGHVTGAGVIYRPLFVRTQLFQRVTNASSFPQFYLIKSFKYGGTLYSGGVNAAKLGYLI